MSDLTARIRAFQDIVRQALHQELSLEEQTELAAIMEALRPIIGNQDASANDPSRVGPPRSRRYCSDRSARTEWRNVGSKA